MVLAILVNLALTVTRIAGGILSGSLALVADATREALRKRLRALGIGHSTLELECHRHACGGAVAIGHGGGGREG